MYVLSVPALSQQRDGTHTESKRHWWRYIRVQIHRVCSGLGERLIRPAVGVYINVSTDERLLQTLSVPCILDRVARVGAHAVGLNRLLAWVFLPYLINSGFYRNPLRNASGESGCVCDARVSRHFLGYKRGLY